MTELDELAEQFEAHRVRLRGVAYRMLGSLTASDDAVQEAWLRLARSDVSAVHNLGGWLTTVVSRLCLDALRARAARHEEPTGDHDPGEYPAVVDGPERDAEFVDQVGRAVLVVLDALSPSERIAFVLHDMFGVPFDEIGPVVDRSPATAKKLASRARHRLRGTRLVGTAELRRQSRIVDAFLAASRAGDIDGVIAVLDPDVVRTGDRFAIPAGRPLDAHGARTVAEEIVVFGRRARFATPALVDGRVGIIVAPNCRLQLVLLVTVRDERIARYELVADPAWLSTLEIALIGPVVGTQDA